MNDQLMASFFKPWIGENFASRGYQGHRILVLGESHYCEIEAICQTCGVSVPTGLNCGTFTKNVVQNFLNYKETGLGFERWMNTFTKFGNVLKNRHLSSSETFELWHAVTFYNFVQVAVIDKRVSPSSENFQRSEAAFFRVLEQLQPDLVICWGKRLWGNMPGIGRPVRVADISYHLYPLQSGRNVPAFQVNHPSTSSFNYGTHEILTKAIQNCKVAVKL